uniref:Uncharacterized protein n=1 Tax=Oryza glumipatula TaxID=40148 RepID=A0A0E0BAL6_9ORYZ
MHHAPRASGNARQPRDFGDDGECKARDAHQEHMCPPQVEPLVLFLDHHHSQILLLQCNAMPGPKTLMQLKAMQLWLHVSFTGGSRPRYCLLPVVKSVAQQAAVVAAAKLQPWQAAAVISRQLIKLELVDLAGVVIDAEEVPGEPAPSDVAGVHGHGAFRGKPEADTVTTCSHHDIAGDRAIVVVAAAAGDDAAAAAECEVIEVGRRRGGWLLELRKKQLVVVVVMLLLLFAAARSLALSSARASQKALCVSRLSFLQA